MTAISEDEITAGMVVHLSPEKLVSMGGCEVKCPKGTEVKDSHYFLITEVEGDKLLATPLYSDKGEIRDRILLNEDDKYGKHEQWIGCKSYYYKWQFWRIPKSSVNEASAMDNSLRTNRRRYKNPSAVMADLGRLREEWRDPSSN